MRSQRNPVPESLRESFIHPAAVEGLSREEKEADDERDPGEEAAASESGR
jgi:hypothetical protein